MEFFFLWPVDFFAGAIGAQYPATGEVLERFADPFQCSAFSLPFAAYCLS
jgi:hypothetical protein